MTVVAHRGVFTQRAEVLCWACEHGGDMSAGTDGWGDRVSRGLKPEGTELAVCDTCAAPVWVREDVAELQAAVRAVNTAMRGHSYARLEQTGGMCCALRVDVDDCEGVKTYLLVALDEDVVDEGLLVVSMWFEKRDADDWVPVKGVRDVCDLVQLVKLLAPVMPLAG